MPRRNHDQYFTPTFATRELLARVPISGRVFEPCAGDGAIAAVVGEDHNCWRNDIDPSMPDLHYELDAADPASWEHWTDFDWIVSNPPFSHATRIIPLAFEHARVGIAMLLRKSYTEPCVTRHSNRGPWLLEHKDHFANQIFLPRISFTGDGKTDNVACDWYVWTKEPVKGCEVDWVLPASRIENARRKDN